MSERSSSKASGAEPHSRVSGERRLSVSAETLDVAPDRLARIVELIESAPAPLIVIWGWPGLGKRQLYRALMATWGGTELAREALIKNNLTQHLARFRTGRQEAGDHSSRSARRIYGVSFGTPRGMAIDRCLDALRSHERLLMVATERPNLRREDSDLVLFVGPLELVLRREEADRWWHVESAIADDKGAAAGEAVAPEMDFGVAWEQSQGYYEPLRILRAAGPRTTLESSRDWNAFVEARLSPWILPAAGAQEDGGSREATWRRSFGGLGWPVAVLQTLAGKGTGERTIGGRRSMTAADSTAHRPTVELLLLGRPELRSVVGDAEAESPTPMRVPHRRLMILLAALATAPARRRHRDELLDMLWPDYGQDRALSNLRPALSATRRLIREAIHPATVADPLPREGTSYSLSTEIRWRVDVERFVHQVQSTRVQAESPAEQPSTISDPENEASQQMEREKLIEVRDTLLAAWRSYRGPFLSGLAVTPWVRDQRTALELLWDEMLGRLAEAHETLGEWEQALDAYRSILAWDATREDVHLSVMRLYSLKRRPDLVRRQYDLLSRSLLEELDTRPLDATARAYYSLLSQPEE